MPQLFMIACFNKCETHARQLDSILDSCHQILLHNSPPPRRSMSSRSSCRTNQIWGIKIVIILNYCIIADDIPTMSLGGD